MERLIVDICLRLPEFQHIDPQRLLICVSRTKGDGIHGTYAKIHPLRFAGGSLSTSRQQGRRTVTCTLPVIRHRGNEILYLIYFLFPRFFDLSEREKLITILHELYHISPNFDGDLRRFPGKNFAHGSSTKKYNARMAQLLDDYLAKWEDPLLIEFLKLDMAELKARHNSVVGRSYPIPKLTIS